MKRQDKGGHLFYLHFIPCNKKLHATRVERKGEREREREREREKDNFSQRTSLVDQAATCTYVEKEN